MFRSEMLLYHKIQGLSSPNDKLLRSRCQRVKIPPHIYAKITGYFGTLLKFYFTLFVMPSKRRIQSWIVLVRCPQFWGHLLNAILRPVTNGFIPKMCPRGHMIKIQKNKIEALEIFIKTCYNSNGKMQVIIIG